MRNKKSKSSPDIMRPAEVFERLGIGKDVGYAMLKANKIPNLRAGKRFLIPRVAFEQMLTDVSQRHAA